MENKRMTDKFFSKFSRGSLVTIILFLFGIVGFFAGRDYKRICETQDIHTKAIQEIKDDLLPLKITMPQVLEQLKTMNFRLGKHLER